MVTAIDPNAFRTSGKTVKTASGAQDFSVFMGAMAPAGAEGTVQGGGDTRHAAVTQAAMTGLSGASAPYNSPYMGSLGAGAALGVATTNPFDAGAATPAYTGGTAPASTAAAGAGAVPFENASQDFLEKDYILNKMHSDSLNMLVLQAQVQQQSRQFTMVSNMLQSRDRTLHNLIQNMRGM
ncbi:MAG: hypothetical protein HYT76_06100 [Deltaproteobacteria bacterium]|nr:hypothetical protein [Deltaproteobacteria bacterium]